MKSIFIFTFILDLLCTRNLVKINDALLLENNFWGKNEIPDDNDNKSLKMVRLNLWNKECSHSVVLFNEWAAHFNPNENKLYHSINSDVTEIILSHLKKKKEIGLEFIFIFDNSQFKNESFMNFYKLGFTQYYDYKALTKDANENIVFDNDNFSIKRSHIEKIMSKLVQCKSVILDIYDTVIDDQFKDQTSKFTLLYFESLSSCFENFKKFVDFLNWRKNEKIYSHLINKKGPIENYKNTLKISELKQNLNEMFNDDFNEVNSKYCQNFDGKARFLFDKFLHELKISMSSGHVIFPIGGICTRQIYYKKIYEQITELIQGLFSKTHPYFNNFPIEVYEEYVCKFRTFIKNLSDYAISNVWASFNMEEYLTDFFGIKTLDVEDYIKADEVFCDFLNMILYILNEKNIFTGFFSEVKYADTTLIDKFKCKLIKAFEIEFKRQALFGEIKAYNLKGNEIKLEKDNDMFYDYFSRNKKIIILKETILRKNIQKIEVFSSDKELLKTITFQRTTKSKKSRWDHFKSFINSIFES